MFSFINRYTYFMKFIRRQMHTNRLGKEKSPYLLQHAHNPVDWYPWGDEAFSLARASNKPIFLSIGYSTCHWCHVMERESFESEDIAKVMNENFVNIKVDREERPDVDAQFMTFVVATNQGHGGWPMSVFLTPKNLAPFFGGTYFDPASFVKIMRLINDKWKLQQKQIEASGQQILEDLAEAFSKQEKVKANIHINKDKAFDSALEYFKKKYDAKYGGFGGAPKFPTPVNMQFLIDFYKLRNNSEALEMVKGTLMGIWRGGIHDHLATGIHRYSVDRTWLLPHFEKMLYDQGQLLSLYSQIYQFTSQKEFYDAIMDISSYIRTNLRHPDGGFYCAEDADSLDPQTAQKSEGAFAVWTQDEIEKILLSPREVNLFCSHFGVEKNGNVPSHYDHHGELKGKNVLMEQRSISESAKLFNISEEECTKIIEESKKALLSVRNTRPKPHLDDKIIVSWNALAISGLCRAYEATKDDSLLLMAKQSVKFIRENLVDQHGNLYRNWREGRGAIRALAIDYVFLIRALLDLWNTTIEPEYLSWAFHLQSIVDDLFWDKEAGGYFNHEQSGELPLRLKDTDDGAEPSLNSVAAMNLIQFSFLSEENGATFKKMFDLLINGLAMDIERLPFARPAILSALLFEHSDPQKITFLLPKNVGIDRLLPFKVKTDKYPFKLYSIAEVNGNEPGLTICQGNTCQAPTHDPNSL